MDTVFWVPGSPHNSPRKLHLVLLLCLNNRGAEDSRIIYVSETLSVFENHGCSRR